jgi:DNA-binding winged helix-turn-helix (wHTH) protein/Tol biopolymer transport system component
LKNADDGFMTASNSCVFRFEDVEVREREFCLIKAGKALAVEPKAFRVLLFLLRNPGKVVTKEELLNAVWSDAAVTENSLTRSILKLRRVLEDDAHEPRYIETVATVGYRFVCKVDAYEDVPSNPETHPLRSSTFAGKSSGAPASLYVLQAAHAPALASAAPQPVPIPAAAAVPAPRAFRWPWLLAGALLAVGLACFVWYLRRPLPSLRISQYTQITHDSRQKALIGTDGARLFSNNYSAEAEFPAEVSIAGGETVPVPMALPDPWMYDVSPDGTALLVTSFDKGLGSLWSIGSAGNPRRHLADGDKGDIGSAAWSPDGRSVAYSTSNGDLHVMRSDGTGAQVLGTVPYRTDNAMFEQISWSPDGKTIRFDRNNRIFEVSLDKPGVRPFLPGRRPSSWQCCGRWTPDGRFFLFLVWDNPLKAYPLVPPFQIWALDERHGLFRRASAKPFQLTSGPTHWARPVPAKDGKTIFARGINLNGELVRLDAQSHQFQPYLGGISAEGVTFSSVGKFVAYVTYPEGILWRADRDGSNRIQLTDPPLYPVLPRWSPDGSQILFAAADSAGDSHSYILSSQGGTPQPILPESKGEQGDPNWSADGRRIVFDSWEGEGENRKHVTRILDVASRQVTTLPGDNWSARWSPTGRFLAGLSQNTSELMLFDFETDRWSVLLKERADFPTWSHDGQFIYFLRMSGNSGVYRIRPTGGQPEWVVDLKGFHHAGYFSFWMGLDQDDNPLLLRDLGGDDIYALTLEEK